LWQMEQGLAKALGFAAFHTQKWYGNAEIRWSMCQNN
jgi:hypothetical protein